MNCKLTLGEKLKDLRTAAGLSLVELEEATGISKSALGSYESDDTKKEITMDPYEFKAFTDILQRYSDAFKIPKGNGRGKR